MHEINFFSKKGDTEERLQNLEKIAVHQNKVMEEMHEAMLKTTPEPPKTTATTITTKVEHEDESSVHDEIMVEHIKEMAKLQRQLLLQQHQQQMANLESQKDAVRDEIEQVANLLINGRSPRRSDLQASGTAPAGVNTLRKLLLRQGRGRMADRLSKKFDSMPSRQAVAWHQRFSDNFRLRQLQHQALRLRGPVLMPKS